MGLNRRNLFSLGAATALSDRYRVSAAAFPLVETTAGRALLTACYDDYAEIAQRAGASLMLESPTWRASGDWGALLGYSPAALARVNEAAITMPAGLRDRYAVPQVLIGGTIGQRGDGYRPDHIEDPDAAAAYHRRNSRRSGPVPTWSPRTR